MRYATVSYVTHLRSVLTSELWTFLVHEVVYFSGQVFHEKERSTRYSMESGGDVSCDKYTTERQRKLHEVTRSPLQ